MSELPDSPVTAALTFRVPQKIGWSVQCDDQSWTGHKLTDLLDFLTQEARRCPVTLSLSLIFELTGDDGTVRLSSGIPPGDGQ